MIRIDTSDLMRAVNRQIHTLTEQKIQELDRVLEKGSLEIHEQAVYNSPVDTGNLRRNIKTKRIGTCHYRVYVDTENVPYAKFVHEGTRKTRARPFLKEAFNRNKRKIKEELEEVLE